MQHRISTTLSIAILAAVGGLFAAEPSAKVPFGHADWTASPTGPVGFAGKGNNWYPGATPQLTW